MIRRRRMHSGGVPVPASPLLLILPTDHQMNIWLLRIGKELHMSKQAKKSKKSNEAKVIKPFYVYLEGEKVQITSPREKSLKSTGIYFGHRKLKRGAGNAVEMPMGLFAKKTAPNAKESRG